MKTSGETSTKFIEMLLNESTALLVRHGETRSDAERLARDFVLSYAQKISGQKLYFRKDTKFQAQAKRNNIRADFWAGITVFELSVKHKLSNVRIYQIIKQKEVKLEDSDTSLKAPLMIEAVRMLLKAGIKKEDTTNAARGLVAVVLARFSGIVLTIPQQDTIKTVIRNIEIYRMYKAGKSIYNIAKRLNLSEPEITAIIEAHPKSPVPGAKELPILRKQLFTMAENFRDKNIEVFSLLEAAADKVMQAHEVIKFAEI